MVASLNSMLALIVSSLFTVLPAETDDIPMTPTWPEALNLEVERVDQEFDGNLGILVEDLNTNIRFTYNAGQRYYLASVVKIFVMAEIYRLIEEKKLSWNDTVKITHQKYRDGAGYVNWMKPGTRISIRKLLNFMMNKSDNAATDILMDIAGLPQSDDIARKNGVFDLGALTSMVDVRKIVWREVHPVAGNFTAADFMTLWRIKSYDQKLISFAKMVGKPTAKFSYNQLVSAFNKYFDAGYNSASLIAMLDFFKNLEAGSVVSEDASKQMRDVLKDCKTGLNRIKKSLPKDWAFGHKTGTQFRRICDMGVTYGTNEEKLAILMCATDFTSRQKAEAVFAEVTSTMLKLWKDKTSVIEEPETLKQELAPKVY